MDEEKKMELLTKIAEGLNGNGWSDLMNGEKPFSPVCGSLKGFGYLPVENLEGIIAHGFNESTPDDWYQNIGAEGLLKMIPYVINYKGKPILVIRHNKFMSLNSASVFQVTRDVDGTTGCAAGYYEACFLSYKDYPDEVSGSSILTYMLWWAAFMEVGFRYDSVRELFTIAPYVLDNFLKSCIHEATGYWLTYRVSDLDKYVQTSRGHIPDGGRVLHQIMIDGKVQARIVVGKNTIKLERYDGVLTQLTVPDISIGTSYTWDKDKRFLNTKTELFNKFRYINILALMVINMAGLCVTQNSIYWQNKIPVGSMDLAIHNIDVVWDMDGIVPDEN